MLYSTVTCRGHGAARRFAVLGGCRPDWGEGRLSWLHQLQPDLDLDPVRILEGYEFRTTQFPDRRAGDTQEIEVCSPRLKLFVICYAECEVVQAGPSEVEAIAACAIRLTEAQGEPGGRVVEQHPRSAGLASSEAPHHGPAEDLLVPRGAGFHIGDRQAQVSDPERHWHDHPYRELVPAVRRVYASCQTLE
jgi:hypothetical protein